MGGKCGKNLVKKQNRYIDTMEDSISDSASSRSSSSISFSTTGSVSASTRRKSKSPYGTKYGTKPTSTTNKKIKPQTGKSTKVSSENRKAVKRVSPLVKGSQWPQSPKGLSKTASSNFPYGKSSTVASKYYIAAKDLHSKQAIILMPKQPKTPVSQCTSSRLATSPPAPNGGQLLMQQYYEQQLQPSLNGPLLVPPPNYELMQQFEHIYKQQMQCVSPSQSPSPLQTKQCIDTSSTSTQWEMTKLQNHLPPPQVTFPPLMPQNTTPSNQLQQQPETTTRIVMLEVPKPTTTTAKASQVLLPLPKPEDYYSQLRNAQLQNQIVEHFEQQVKVRNALPCPPPPSSPQPSPQPLQQPSPTITHTIVPPRETIMQIHQHGQSVLPLPSPPQIPYFSPAAWQHYYEFKQQQQQLRQQTPPPPMPRPPMNQFELYIKQQMSSQVPRSPVEVLSPQCGYYYPMNPQAGVQYQGYIRQTPNGVGGQTMISNAVALSDSSVTPDKYLPSTLKPLKSLKSTNTSPSKTTSAQLDTLHRDVQELKRLIKAQDTKELIDQCLEGYRNIQSLYQELLRNKQLHSQIGSPGSMLGERMKNIQNNYDDITSKIKQISTEVRQLKQGVVHSPESALPREQKFQKSSLIHTNDLTTKMERLMSLIKTMKEMSSIQDRNNVSESSNASSSSPEASSDKNPQSSASKQP